MLNTHKYCSIFGHKYPITITYVKKKVKDELEKLINNGIDRFIFGSVNEFTEICYSALKELKVKYPHIKTVRFLTKNEQIHTSKEEREEADELMSKILKKEVHFYDYDIIFKPEEVYYPNRDVYIMRDTEMINVSDICLVYYVENQDEKFKANALRNTIKFNSLVDIAYFIANSSKTVININD